MKDYKDIIAGLLIIFGAILLLGYIGTAIFSTDDPKYTKEGLGGEVALDTEYIFTSTTTRHVATTSPVFLETDDTASTTMELFVEETNRVDLNMLFNASTTASKLVWQYQFSQNGIDWYTKGDSTETSNTVTTHGATGDEHQWTPAVAGDNFRSVSVDPVSASYMRIKFGVGDANGSLHVEAVKRQEVR